MWGAIVLVVVLAVAWAVSADHKPTTPWTLKAAPPSLVLSDADQAAAVYQAGQFQVLPGHSVNRYQAGDLWLAVELPQDVMRAAGSVLTVLPATLPHVEAYRLTVSGQALPMGAAGLQVPRAEWPMVARGPKFVLDKQPEFSPTVLVKVSARQFALAIVKVETAAQHHVAAEQEVFLLGCVLSLAVVTLVASLLAWRVAGDGEFLLWAGQALSGMIYIAYVHGLIVAYLPTMPYEVHAYVFWITVVIMIWTVSAFGAQFLDFKALHPHYPRVINLLALAAAPIAVVSVWQGWGTALIRLTQAGLIVLFTVGVACQMWRGHPLARRYGLVVLLLALSGIPFLLLQVGVVPVTHLSLYTWQYALAACDLALLRELVSRFLLQRRLAREAQIHLQNLLLDEKAQLEQRVVERTAALVQANEELERAEVQQRELLSMASHEFRSPAAAIQTTLDALEYLREPIPSVMQDRLDHLQAAARRLTFLANRLIEHDRWRERSLQVHSEVLDLRAWLIDVLGDYPDGLPLSLDLPLEPVWVRVDPVLMRIACQNLIDNALNQAPKAQAQVRIQLRAETRGVRLRVSDNGPGVPDEFKQRVFDRFFSPKASLRNGLGLSIVRTVAQLHGGDVEVTDAQPRGACFSITVPSGGQEPHSANTMSLTQ
ncbi:MAG: sensor histidine kinase [Ideonella sp.]|nr:sensor histidine kinase [Ideonella sp.]